MSEATRLAPLAESVKPRARIGCVGVGWIGRRRMQAVVENCECDVVALMEPQPDLARAAREAARNGAAEICSFDEMMRSDLDGIMIATPSALHAEQTIAALESGISVFCQKPLGRNLEETQRAVEAARSADRLLAVDFSYRFVRGVNQIRELAQSGELGHVFAMELVFHNAYGPDKPWFYDRKLSGGGCLIDLGIHLVDLALWTLNFPEATCVSSRLFRRGLPFSPSDSEVEDYATASLELKGDVAVHLACSWKVHAGCDAEIGMTVYGSRGGAKWHNVNGSFFDFVTERFVGTRRQILSEPPEDWGGRAAVDWAKRLAISNHFDPGIEQAAKVAAILDRIYAP